MPPTTPQDDHQLILIVQIFVIVSAILNSVISILVYRRTGQLKKQRKEASDWFVEEIRNRHRATKSGEGA